MQRKQRPVATFLIAVLVACSFSSPHPQGWQPIQGSGGNGWAHGSGAEQQRFYFSRKPFVGTLHDLASQQAIDNVLKHRGSRLIASDPFGPCPAFAGVERFEYEHRILREGFAVQNGQAVLVTYIRPVNVPIDSSVTQAMKRTLCVAL